MFTHQDLTQFYGTMQYYYHPMFKGINYTDGIQHIGENGAGWLQTDVLSVLTHVPIVAAAPFVAITATPETEGGKPAAVIYGDGDGTELYRQEYMFSDLPCKVEMFFTNGVLMLATEY